LRRRIRRRRLFIRAMKSPDLSRGCIRPVWIRQFWTQSINHVPPSSSIY